MESTLAIVVVGLMLGAIQLATGIIIARNWPRRQESAGPRPTKKSVIDPSGPGGHSTAVLPAEAVERMAAQLNALGSSGEVTLAENSFRSLIRILEINERLRGQLAAAEEKLHEQAQRIESHIVDARTDPLTSLPNRRAFDDLLARRVAEWRRGRIPFCLLMADLDQFKKFNDKYGHPTGDRLLRTVAEVFASTVRAMDLVARIGGEEFAVILPITRLPAAQWIAERIRLSVASRPLAIEGEDYYASISLGLAEIMPDDDATTILERADAALYVSKHAGRDCGHYHNGGSCERIVVYSGGGSSGSTPSDTVEGDLAAVCDSLRRRLAEITQQ